MDKHKIYIKGKLAREGNLWEKEFMARRYERPIYLVRSTLRPIDWTILERVCGDAQWKYIYYHNLTTGARHVYVLKPKTRLVLLQDFPSSPTVFDEIGYP